eukprot:5098463-Heterocapsa_arctica.AAC.1
MALNGPASEDAAALSNTSVLIRLLGDSIESLTVAVDQMRERRDRRPEMPEIPEEPETPEIPERPVKAEKPGRRARGRANSARLWKEAFTLEP